MTCCPIQQITIESYTRQQNCTWYTIQLKLNNNLNVQIQHKDADFVQFSRSIHQQFKLAKEHLIEIKNQYIFLKKKGSLKFHERVWELQHFCQQLLMLPDVTCSESFLLFFSTTTAITTVSNSIRRAFSIFSNKKQQQQQHVAEICDVFTRLNTIQKIDNNNRCSTTSTTSTTSSSVLCSSSLGTTDDEDTVKIKIIYDIENIIIIRVSRRVSLDELSSQVVQKFALLNIQFSDQLLLRTVDCAWYASGSGSSTICSVPADSGLSTDILIRDQQDLSRAMLSKQKVTLRCVV
ncbi:hypothetical protein [Parasitella parasitica]|uniref:PX domain-containing protein n=1 Tax=Parasitella parasitica TaxID=35722 RepID=A0A0B7NTQ1_9FUNG|nr:hypothetical protein [Parasitella parasitica]